MKGEGGAGVKFYLSGIANFSIILAIPENGSILKIDYSYFNDALVLIFVISKSFILNV